MTTATARPDAGAQSHPAKFSPGILEAAAKLLHQCGLPGALSGRHPRVLDPFAGTGRIHELRRFGYRTNGIELEPEWAARDERTTQGTALALPWRARTFDAIVTSPCYGNRMADRDMRPTVAGTYMKSLGREASEGSACHLQWGEAYREFHLVAWAEAVRVLRYGGVFVLNISNHYRAKQERHVSAWHFEMLEGLGLRYGPVEKVKTPRQRFGANHLARCRYEYVAAFTKPMP